MVETKWIKIVTDIFDNEKIRMIEAMPEGDAIIVIWFKLLMLAGRTNDRGCVYFTEDIPYTEQMLSTYFGRPLTIIQLALSTFQKFRMIEIIDDVIFVSNWEKYQNVEGLEKIREQGRIRAERFRERKKIEQKNNSNVTRNVTVTQSNATDKDKDKDIDIDNKRYNYCSKFEEFWSIYPRKKEKAAANKQFLTRIKEGFSENEILEAAKIYAAECKKDNREEKYIKLPKTFLGPNTPFVDYLPKQPKTDAHGREYKDGALVWNIKFPETEAPPYYGAPEEWFENGELVPERVTGVYQPEQPQFGWHRPKVLTREEVLEEINFRKEYFAKHGEIDS